jgi:hypothetical protein
MLRSNLPWLARSPTALYSSRELLLACLAKRSVVPLGDFDRRVSKQKRYLVDWIPREQQFHRKGVPKHVGMAALWSVVLAAQLG